MVKTCASCGHENADDAKWCGSCKKFLSGSRPPATPPPVVPQTPIGEQNAENGRIESGQFTVTWPWDRETEVGQRLFVGRVPPVPEGLAAELEESYLTVSRMHAEFFVQDSRLMLRDLGSSNGTFRNGVRLDSFAIYPVSGGDRVRFGEDLEIEIRIKEGEST